LITSFGNNPNLLNVRNDFAVWGTYKSMSGTDIPIHMRYAIDTKPTDYFPIRSLWTRERGTDEKEAPKDYVYFSNLKNNNESIIENIANADDSIISTYFKTSPFTISGKSFEWREIIY
jgi:hypothetical protein